MGQLEHLMNQIDILLIVAGIDKPIADHFSAISAHVVANTHPFSVIFTRPCLTEMSRH